MSAIEKENKKRASARMRAEQIKAKKERDAQADAEWDRILAKNPDALAKLAKKALQDFEEGRTEELDPDKL